MKTLALLAVLASSILWGQTTYDEKINEIDKNFKETVQKLNEYSKYNEENILREKIIEFWQDYKKRGEFEGIEEYNHRMNSESITKSINSYIIGLLGNRKSGEYYDDTEWSVRPVWTINNEIYVSEAKMYYIEIADRKNHINLIFGTPMEMEEARAFRNAKFREESMYFDHSIRYNIGDMANIASENIFVPLKIKYGNPSDYSYYGEAKEFYILFNFYENYIKKIPLTALINEIAPQYDSTSFQEYIKNKSSHVRNISWGVTN